MNRLVCIVTGTDPTSAKGGISSALCGYFEVLDEAEIHYIFIPTHHATRRYGRWKPWLMAMPRLISCTLRERFDGNTVIVYAHAGAGLSLFRQAVLLSLARSFGARCLLHLHAPEISHYVRKPLGKVFFRLLVFPAHELCVLTEWWKQQLSGFGKKMNVIPNPITKSLAAVANASEIIPPYPLKLVNILCLTRLVKGKGVDMVIQAMPLLPTHFRLTIAGTGTQEMELKEMAMKLEVQDRVDFIGWVSGDEQKKVLMNSHLFCLPTKLDSFGMVFVEAMAYGLPVVALKWGAIGDVVPSGEAGVLIEGNDESLLAGAILSVLSDKSKYEDMSVKAKHWVVEQFSAQAVSMKLLAAMRSVI